MRTIWEHVGLGNPTFREMCRFSKCADFVQIFGKCADFLLPDSSGTLHASQSSAGGRTNEVRDVVNWNGINMFPDLHAVSWICTYLPVRLHIPQKICTKSAHFLKICTKICTSRKSAHFVKSHASDANVLPDSAHRVRSESTETLFLF